MRRLAQILLNACTLMPENPSAVESWRDHFLAVRRRYFLGVVCWMLTVAAITTLALEMPWSHPGRFGQATVLGAGLVGACSAKPRVLGAVMALLFGWYVALVSAIGFHPGSLAP